MAEGLGIAAEVLDNAFALQSQAQAAIASTAQTVADSAQAVTSSISDVSNTVSGLEKATGLPASTIAKVYIGGAGVGSGVTLAHQVWGGQRVPQSSLGIMGEQRPLPLADKQPEIITGTHDVINNFYQAKPDYTLQGAQLTQTNYPMPNMPSELPVSQMLSPGTVHKFKKKY